MDLGARWRRFCRSCAMATLSGDGALAQALASEHPHAYFLTPERRVLPQRDGDGRQAGERRSAGAEARTARDGDAAGCCWSAILGEAEMEAAALTRQIEELTRALEARSEERRQAERDAADQGAALKQMENGGAAHRAAAAGVDAAGGAQQGSARSQACGDRAEARRGGAAGSGARRRPRRLSKSSRTSWRRCGRRARRCSRKRRS